LKTHQVDRNKVQYYEFYQFFLITNLTQGWPSSTEEVEFQKMQKKKISNENLQIEFEKYGSITSIL